MARRRATEPALPLDLADRLALRPAEAARALGISERTLRTLLPRLPVVRTAGCVLLPVKALEQWLEEHAQAGRTRIDATVEEHLGQIGGGERSRPGLRAVYDGGRRRRVR